MRGLMPDSWIKEMAISRGMIEPFVDHLVRDGVISYGLSSFGYDVRLADEFLVARRDGTSVIDPKNVDHSLFASFRMDSYVILPGTSVLGRSVEYIRMPDDTLGLVFGKSTYARCGILINVTPLEPGWEGYITISISNTSHMPVVLHPNEGIAQIVFFRGATAPEVTYALRSGVYQGQSGITLPRVRQFGARKEPT